MKRKPRPGATLFEVSIALLLMAAAVAGASQAIALTLRQQVVFNRRVVATHEAANVLDQVMSWPVQQVTQPRLDALRLDSAVERQLPGSKLSVRVDAANNIERRITVELLWNSETGKQASVQLVAFKHTAGKDLP